MSSRPPSPPPIYQRSSEAPQSSMAETQTPQTTPYGMHRFSYMYHNTPPRLPPPPQISIPPPVLSHTPFFPPRNSPLLPAPHPSSGYSAPWTPSTGLERLASNTILYTSPVPDPRYAPYTPFDHPYEHGPRPPPRISERETPPEHTRHGASAMPSPTYTSKRVSDGSYRTSDPPSAGLIPTPRSAPSVDPPAQSPRSSDGRYEIRVRQQPEAARSCGFGERDRRVIDPPPIVQLLVKDPKTGVTDSAELRYPFNVLHCTLWSADGTSDETAIVQEARTNRRLMGTLVSSPFVGKDDEGQEGSFFCFPDLSCRTPGRYRLRFVLMRLEPDNVQPGSYSNTITSAMSEVFTVYNAKDFPGMRASTALTKALKSQGCAISVKKGNERVNEKATERARQGAHARTHEDVSDDNDEQAGGARSKRRRK